MLHGGVEGRLGLGEFRGEGGVVRVGGGELRVEIRDLGLQGLDFAGEGLEQTALLIREARGRVVAFGRGGFERGLGLGGGGLLCGLLPGFGGLPIAVAAGVGGHAALFHHEDGGRHVVDEVAVVRDEQERPLVVGELLLQQLQRLDVQVVGRLVHHQQVAGIEEEACQEEPCTFAARECLDRRAGALRGEEEVAQIAVEVFADAADGDELLALGDVFGHGGLGVERAAELVEEGRLHVAPQALLARLRRQAAQDEVEQGGLAGAVGADDAHALPAQDAQRDVPQDGLGGVVAKGHTLATVDQVAGAALGGERERGVAALRAPLGEFLAQFHQRRHAALVAAGAGLDATAEPGFFLGELLGLALPVDRLVRQEVGLAAEEGGIVAIPPREDAAIQIEDRLGHGTQEGAVVRDEETREGGGGEELFQPLDGEDVQVVRRLVQEQEVWLPRQGASEQDAAAESAGEGVERRLRRQGETRAERVRHVGPRGVVQGIEEDVAHRPGAVLGDVLRQVGHACGGGLEHFPGVRLQDAGDDLQQGGLALAVAPRDARAGPRLDAQRNILQDGCVAEPDRDVMQSDECHRPHSITQGAPLAPGEQRTENGERSARQARDRRSRRLSRPTASPEDCLGNRRFRRF